MAESPRRIGILCGGGPAPGINSVIGAATIRAEVSGVPVVGIRDGFKWLMQGDTRNCVPLSIRDVSRLHFTGGSYLGISRANPTRDPKYLEAVTTALGQLGVDQLITIGGDDTAFSAMKLAAHAGGRLRVIHVPKTIDNDLDLPHGISTFGFQTARHVGVEIVKNLMVDAQTTGRWYVIVAMGRKAGHLALGIGKAAAATLTIIPEEFSQTPTPTPAPRPTQTPIQTLGPDADPDRAGTPIRLDEVVDILVGAIIKRKSMDRDDGTAVLAEGLIERLDPADLQTFGDLERDEHDHLRLAEVNLADVVKTRLRQRLTELGLDVSVVSKDIGYELRCADPIPFDIEYTRDLGFCAAQYLMDGGTAAMVMLVDGRFTPLPFSEMLDPATGRTRVRLVDVRSELYEIARQYMVRLRRADFDDPAALQHMADVVHLSVDEFRARFAYVVEHDQPARRIGEQLKGLSV